MADAVAFIRELVGAMDVEQQELVIWQQQLKTDAMRSLANGQKQGMAHASAFARGYLRALNERGDVPAEHQEWVTLTLKK